MKFKLALAYGTNPDKVVEEFESKVNRLYEDGFEPSEIIQVKLTERHLFISLSMGKKE